MHRVYDEIARAVRIPVLHIADATGNAVVEAGCAKVGLLGTKFTMEGEFYHDRLEDLYDLEVLTPKAADRDIVHRVIYHELCLGKMLEPSRAEFVRIIGEMVERGAEGVILGCTEVSMLIGPDDSPVPTFDTAEIHALKAADWALRS